MRIIQWETAMHHLGSTWQTADVGGHRLYAVREAKSARSFLCKVDGVFIARAKTMAEAKAVLETHAAHHGWV